MSDVPLPAAEILTSDDFLSLLDHLRGIINDLPRELPIGHPASSKYSPFLSFQLDEELVEHTGSDIGALNEQLKQVFGWKARSSGDQRLSIEERGEPILAVADILEQYHLRYPQDNVVKKWGVDVIAGVYKAYGQYGRTPPAWTEQRIRTISDLPSTRSEELITSDPHATTSTGLKGRPPKLLMNKLITKLENGKSWRCVALKCDHVRKGSPQEDRVLKHASTCLYLDPSLKREAIEASKSTSLGAEARAAISTESVSRSLHQHTDSTSSEQPPSKKSKMAQSTLDLQPFHQAAKRKKQENSAAFNRSINLCILKLICVRGLVPNILDSSEWRNLVTSLNPSYSPTSSSTFIHNFIPKEAVSIRDEQIQMLKTLNNLTLTFDGTNTRKPHSIYTVHATTPDRKTYFLEGYEESGTSHTTEWVKGKILKTIRDVGEEKWAGICSDSTSVTKKARNDIVTSEIPTILDLDDACHHIHNTIKDITSAAEFQHMLSMLKPIIKHFSKSTKAVAHLRKERRIGTEDEKVNMLQKIGKTRFGTHWLAAASLEQCFPNIRNLVLNKDVKFKNKKVQEMFLNRHQSVIMEHEMSMYISIVAPFVRSLWALEAAHANASDVYVFWLAIGATLKDLFIKGEDKTGIPSSLKQHVTNTYNVRWKKFFANEVYFTAFALDPRYPLSDFLVRPTLAPPMIRIPPQNQSINNTETTPTFSKRPLPYQRAYERVKEFLKKRLRIMLNYHETHLDIQDELSSIVREVGFAGIVEEFRHQLESYWLNEWPFNIPVSDNDPYTWWKTLQAHPHARVLSILATKIFGVLVNSMPDERTGSTLTWLNSPLRANQNAQTLIDMIQVGQYYKEMQSKKTAQKEPYRPVVKFRDMDSELIRAVSLGRGKGSAPSDDSCIPADATMSDSESDESEFDMEFTGESDAGSVIGLDEELAVMTGLLTDEEVSLDSPLLRDLLATEPVTNPAQRPLAHTAAKMTANGSSTVKHNSTATLDWGF